VRVDVDPVIAGRQQVFATVHDHPSNYADLHEPEAITLRFVAGIDAVLRGIAEHVDSERPEALPRTRRERQWIETGHEAPRAPAFLEMPIRENRRAITRWAEDRFWALMDELDGEMLAREDGLRRQLRSLTLADLAACHVTFVSLTRSLCSQELWAAADSVMGWVSDDVFTDLRCWIVAQGRTTYDLVRTDPSQLAGVLADVDLEEVGAAEALAVMPDELYADRTGRSIDGDYLGIEPHELPDVPPSTAT